MARLAEVDLVRISDEKQLQATAAIRWWMVPQVLSLDASTVAVCWQWLFAKSFHVPITPSTLFVTAGCVWMIYAADHLLDVRRGAVCSARHLCISHHTKPFVIAGFTVFAVAAVASSQLPPPIWRGAVELTAVVGIYLALVHCGLDQVRRFWPKEFAIGAVFASGSSIATWSAAVPARQVWPEIALFAALCTLNCCAVDDWEWQTNRVLLQYPQRATRWVAKHFAWCAAAVVVAGATMISIRPSAPIMAAIAGTLLLTAVIERRRSLSPELARLLADAALLTPALFLLR